MNRIYTLPEIDELIKKYKKTEDEVYLKELFKAFEGFIVKYANFLKNGKYLLNDRDLVGLIKLLKKGDKDPIELIKQLFDNWDYYDILNELNLTFLKAVKQFVKRKNGPYFTGYLYNYYKYMVKEWIEKISKDAMNVLRKESIDNLKKDDKKFIEENENFAPTEYENICLTERTSLTQLEKYVLYLHYGKKISVIKIAEMLGLDRTLINVIKKEAKEKLKNSGMTLDDFEKL